MNRFPFSTANLSDFKDVNALKSASRQELEEWYYFQAQCLFALIGRFGRDGHTIIVDAQDIPIGNQKMYVMPLSEHACSLHLREVPNATESESELQGSHPSSGPRGGFDQGSG